MINQFSRLQLGIGEKKMNLIKNSKILIVGIGGVGSFSVESLARSGVNTLYLVDNDTIDITNINRQIHSNTTNIGNSKVQEMKERVLKINPDCNVITFEILFNDETCDEILSNDIDFVIDASDTITFKILLIKECLKRKIEFISSMGAANKLDPTKFEITDIRNTSYDPIAKVIRREIKKLKINDKIPVVYSKEKALTQDIEVLKEISVDGSTIRKKKLPPSSNSFVPSVAGLICTSYVIRKIIGDIN